MSSKCFRLLLRPLNHHASPDLSLLLLLRRNIITIKSKNASLLKQSALRYPTTTTPKSPPHPSSKPIIKTALTPTPTTSTSTTPSFASIPALLAAAGKPTLLYASYPRSFILFCYTLSSASVAYASYIYFANVRSPPPTLPGWVVKVNYFTIGAMSLIAAVCFFFPTRIVHKIYAHPIQNDARSVRIVLHRRPWVPLMPNTRIEIAGPHMLVLDRPLQPPVAAAESQTKHEAVVAEEGAMARTARSVINAPRKAFYAMRRAITTQDFVGLVYAEGGNWQIHKDGWVWRKRGLDMLFGSTKF